MSHRTTIDEDDESPIPSASLLTNNQRASQTRLLTRIYYPDTLYPDNYSFFADRADTSVPPVRSSSPMDPSHQYPTTESASPPVIVSPLSRQGTTEIEILDRPNKYVVSQAGFFLFFPISFRCISALKWMRDAKWILFSTFTSRSKSKNATLQSCWHATRPFNAAHDSWDRKSNSIV